jgi:CHASE2 domain-containing sensor protein
MSNKFYLLLRDSFICTLASVLTCGVLYFIFIHVHILDPFTKAFEDFSFTDVYTAKNFKSKTPTDKIILVNVGNADRATIAKGIDVIAENNPKAIGVDIIFREKKDVASDSLLKVSLKNPVVVSAYILDKDSLIANDDSFKTHKEGYVNFDESGSVVREFYGTKKVNDKIYSSFATKIAETAGFLTENTKDKLEKSCKINYSGDQNSFLTFDLNDIISGKEIPAVNNAIVLFGYMGVPTGNPKDIEDKHFTPLNAKFAGKSIPDMYGVVIHANVIKMLMDADFIYRVPRWLVFIFAFVFCFVFSVAAILMYKKSAMLFHALLKIFELILSVVLVYMALLMVQQNIQVQIEPVIFLSIIGLEMVILYDHMLHTLRKKYQWKSFL